MKKLILLIVALTLIVMAFIFNDFNKISPIGQLTKDFPDKEACSLACGVGWDTYCLVKGRYSNDGWNAKVGDLINWQIDKKAWGSFRYDGIIINGDGVVEIKVKLNDRLLNGVLDKGIYKLNRDEYVRSGDVISLEVMQIRGDGFVKDIEPSGVH